MITLLINLQFIFSINLLVSKTSENGQKNDPESYVVLTQQHNDANS